MAEAPTFPALILTGRPAAGKSEVIRYLRSLEPGYRSRELHVGPFRELDDFPMIWAWFEEDDLLQRAGRPRLHTNGEGYFRDAYFWHVLIRRLELEYWKLRQEEPLGSSTAILEFARGTEHGGLTEAFAQLTDGLLSQAAVLYIEVSWEESLRKNRRRFNPDKPHSILEHALPEAKLERLYRGSDWNELRAADEQYLLLGGRRVPVPYAVLENEDDVTTRGGDQLGARLRSALGQLWARRQAMAASPAAGDEGAAGLLGRAGDFRIVARDESHFRAHAAEMLISRSEAEDLMRRALAGGQRQGEVMLAVRHSRPVGFSGLRRVSLRDRHSFWGFRPQRSIPSHLIRARRRRTRWLCFRGAWADDRTFLLETFYPGRPAPREIHDPELPASELKQAVAFWSTHAIVVER
jgi:hypothetical protein